MYRLCWLLKSEVDNFKKEYVFILQSFINQNELKKEIFFSNKNLLETVVKSTNMDKYGSQHFYLYGGDKHIERIKGLLAESRAVDPSLPSWESLIENEYFIDRFGFKYSKKSELHHVHYVCQQLSIFYTNQAYHVKEKSFKKNICDWKQNFQRDVCFF